VDGHGVVLNGTEMEHSVIRMQAVSAVKIFTDAPGRTPLPAGAMPMPGPRQSYE
jgi:hypothetical protein